MGLAFLHPLDIQALHCGPDLCLHQSAKEVLALFKHPHGNPQRFFNLLRLRGEQCCRCERMARMAAIPLGPAKIHFPEYPSAVGTIIGHMRAESIHLCHIAQDPFGNAGLRPNLWRSAATLSMNAG